MFCWRQTGRHEKVVWRVENVLATMVRFLNSVFVTMIAFLLASGCASDQSVTYYDILIENAKIIDGTGRPRFDGDVGIVGNRIAAIGKLGRAAARRRIDASGNIVSPGFIDMHSHASFYHLVDSRALSKVSQGITLEVEGEGHSVAPMDDAMARRLKSGFERFGVKGDWRTLNDFFQRLENNPATINFATYLGTENVREMVVGFEDRPATPEELDRMRDIVEAAMNHGALGVYSALMYSPDRYNRTSELVEMAKVASRYGGVYQTHQRSAGNALQSSLKEVGTIAREANIPAHITHVKVAYVQNWGRIEEIIDFVENARAEGLKITADMYPYERASGYFTALLPPWAQEGGREAIVTRLNNPVARQTIKEELSTPTDEWENEYIGTAGGPAGFDVVGANGNESLKPYIGRSIQEIAEAEGKDPRDVVLDIILQGDALFTSHITSEDDIRTVMQRPWVAFGTDGATLAPDGPLLEGLPHPRTYGAFPKLFGDYVRELGLLSLEEAVRRSTSLPASILNIAGRGVLREGVYADIVIFDPETIDDAATYEAPHQLAKGVHMVIVNGEVVYKDGRTTQARPGMVIRGQGYRRN